MKKMRISSGTIIIAVLILVASLGRLLTNWLHIYNFSPIAGMALFGGAYFRDKKLAFIVPIICMLITDAFLGFYSGMIVTYAVFALITCIGFLLRDRVNVFSVISASLASSLLFFLITNALVCIEYPKEYSSLMAAYAAGIPFFGNTVAGDLFYSGVLFGSFELVKRNYPSLAKVSA